LLIYPNTVGFNTVLNLNRINFKIEGNLTVLNQSENAKEIHWVRYIVWSMPAKYPQPLIFPSAETSVVDFRRCIVKWRRGAKTLGAGNKKVC
jgi:hypothetical protein